MKKVLPTKKANLASSNKMLESFTGIIYTVLSVGYNSPSLRFVYHIFNKQNLT